MQLAAKWSYDIKLVIFWLILNLDILSISCEIAQMNAIRPQWWLVNIGSDNEWLVCTIRQHAITWTWVDPDLCCFPYDITRPKWVKAKVPNLKKIPKIQILKVCKTLYMWHTFWCCLIRCIDMNGSNLNSRRYRADMECGMDGWTDGRTDKRTDGWSETNNFVVRRVW